MEEDYTLKVEADPLWTDAASITMYAVDPEDQEFTDVTDTPPPYNNEMQNQKTVDSGMPVLQWSTLRITPSTKQCTDLLGNRGGPVPETQDDARSPLWALPPCLDPP